MAEDKVTWSGRFRPSLDEAETWPRPLQQPIRIWHGSATSKDSVDLAAKWGDPLFSANVTNPIEPYAALVRYYRERWAFYGHDPADVGRRRHRWLLRSQDVAGRHCDVPPIFEARLAATPAEYPASVPARGRHRTQFGLIGSPQQIIDKVLRYHEQLGHEVLM